VLINRARLMPSASTATAATVFVSSPTDVLVKPDPDGAQAAPVGILASLSGMGYQEQQHLGVAACPRLRAQEPTRVGLSAQGSNTTTLA
jgi:hypothetical protein